MPISNQEIEEKINAVNNEIAEAYDDYIQNPVRVDYDRSSKIIVNKFVTWLEKSISPDYQMPDENAIYKFANHEITALDLAERVKDINGFAEEILANIDLDSNKNKHTCEVILGELFAPSLVAVELTQLIQENSSGDIKSDLTEEYAWLFDYIRNVASNEQNASFIDTLRDALAAMPNQKKQSKSNAILEVLKKIKEEIGTNQEKYKMHNPFGGSFFTKATGGLPDVVSVYTEKDDTDADGKNMLNFTAANSLTDLSMESDQLERHGCMLALAIYINGGKVDSNIGQIIDDVVSDKSLARNSKTQRILVDAISGHAKEDNEVKSLLDALNIPIEDLPKIKKILQERINITFFQTYVAKVPHQKIVNGVLNDAGSDGDVEARKELYRQMNQWNSYFLGNSQTIFNRNLDRNRPEIIDSMTTNQNNKSTPLAGAKHIKGHADEIRDFINDKFVSQNLPISVFLEGIAKPNDTGESDKDEIEWREYFDLISSEIPNKEAAQKFFKPATKSMIDKVGAEHGEEYLKSFKEQEEKKQAFLEYSKAHTPDWSGKGSATITGNLERLKKLHKSSRVSTVTPLVEYDAELLSGAGSIELAMISMMISSDIMKESLLQNIFDVLEIEFKQTEDLKLKRELMSQMEAVKDYAGKVLNNRGQKAPSLSDSYFEVHIREKVENLDVHASKDEKISSQDDEIKKLKAQAANTASLEAKIKKLEAAAAKNR